MKVLSMAWTIYDERIKAFQNNATGGGLVIRNLCEYIGRKEESYLFVGSCHLPEQKIGHIHIVGTDMKLSETDDDTVKDKQYLDNMEIKFKLAIERIRPDIVNFHDHGDLMQRCVHVCIKMKVPYVCTNHLYIGSHRNIENYDRSVRWEKELYSVSNLPIIAVSSGVKRKILYDFPQITPSNIHVILNGTDFRAEHIENNYKEKYGLENRKILLCVGTILARKNQIQLVDAFLKLPLQLRKRIGIIFCGNDNMKGELQRKIQNAGLEEDLIYAGVVSSEEMKKYYSIADGLIMPSLAEGLSIAALEAIAYGLPVIMFRDSECADDLNDPEVVCFAENHNDEALVESIEKWYQKDWKRIYIQKYSNYFTMERMADEYIDYYKMRLK